MLVMKSMRIFAYFYFDLVEGSYDYMVMHQICNRASFDEGGRSGGVHGSKFPKKYFAMLSPRCVELRICHVLRQSGGGWKICPKDFGNIRFLDFRRFPALNWTLKGRKENRLKLWPPSKFMTFPSVFHSVFKQFRPKPTNAVFWNRSEILALI